MATPASAHVLIKYNMGKQITRSGLMVLTNGLVMRDETSILCGAMISPSNALKHKL